MAKRGGSARNARTAAIHPKGAERVEGSPVVAPLVQSATFYGGGREGLREPLYSRYGNNPTQRAVADKVAELEGMEAGVVLGSGMAAVAMTVLALTRKGDHIVSSASLYGATELLFREELPRRGVEASFVELDRPRGWEEALRANTRIMYLELPTNPGLRIPDPRPVAELAHANGIVLVADTTFATPFNLRARDHGVDVVVQSATKYLGGHSDLVAGVVTGPEVVLARVEAMLRLYGPALDPHAAWLLDRGLRTLPLRVQTQNRTARVLAQWLEGRAEVERVLYPGLPGHPDHHLAREMFRGHGGVLAVVLRGGAPAADAFCSALEVAAPAPSFGGPETLVSQPRFTSHRGVSQGELDAQGIVEGFVRIAVGLEDPDDLQRDLEGGLAAATLRGSV